MTFEQLRAEYERERIGALILERVAALVRKVAKRYPPGVYAEIGTWDDEAFAALTQSFVTRALLADGQLDYTMAQASELSDFDRLTRHQLRRHLRSLRRRSVVDNLVERAAALLDGGDDSAPRARPREVIAAAVQRVRLIPREVGDPHDRAPRVYSDEDLKRVLDAIRHELREEPTLYDVRNVLATVLTAWVPSDLLPLQDDSDIEPEYPTAEGGPMMAAAELAPEDLAVAVEVVERVTARLDTADASLLRLKFAGTSDAEAAKAAGVSRPTIAARKQRLVADLEADLDDLDEPIQRRILDDLGRWLATQESA